MLSFTSRKPLAADEEFIPESYLWITTGTYQKRPFIAGDRNKELLLESLDFNCYKWRWRILAFAILDNHYHMILQYPPQDPTRLAHIIQSAHSFSAYNWRKDDPRIRSRIWWNCWDNPIDDMDSLRKYINYIHANPLYHQLTSDPATYAYCSYPDYVARDAATIHAWEREHPAAVLRIIDSF